MGTYIKVEREQRTVDGEIKSDDVRLKLYSKAMLTGSHDTFITSLSVPVDQVPKLIKDLKERI